jgi:UDP-N-acetylmuramoyl-tripeptide--D-alanyl-D-alanine ligase
MRTFCMREIAKVTGGRMISGTQDALVQRVSKDSRDVTLDTLFFALIGQNHDAHEFLPQVLTGGSSNWIVSNQDAIHFEGAENANVVLVEDTQAALIALAVFVLDEMKTITIGVTGSVGKTSTKDMIFAVCSQRYKTGKTQANLNTNIGISMCILDFEPDTKVAVLEMGTDHPGEIDQVVRVFQPHIGLITNIGQAHLEHFGTREGIYHAKMEMTNYFTANDLLIIQQGPDFLRKEKITSEFRVQSVGKEKSNDFVVSGIGLTTGRGTEFDLTYRGESVHFNLPVVGVHHAMNAAQAVAVGVELGITLTDAARGLSSLQMTTGRLEVKAENGMKNSIIIDDAYNASPDSMRAGIQTLLSIAGPRKVAILGDMFELGEQTMAFHREIGKFAAEAGVDLIIGVGTLAKELVDAAGPGAEYFETKQDLMTELPKLIQNNDVILVKASRGMALDEVVDYLLSKREIE